MLLCSLLLCDTYFTVRASTSVVSRLKNLSGQTVPRVQLRPVCPILAASMREGDMRRIQQQHGNDCGVACVAMLAGVPYLFARKAVFGERRPSYTTAEQLRMGLAEFGLGRDKGKR